MIRVFLWVVISIGIFMSSTSSLQACWGGYVNAPSFLSGSDSSDFKPTSDPVLIVKKMTDLTKVLPYLAYDELLLLSMYSQPEDIITEQPVQRFLKRFLNRDTIPAALNMVVRHRPLSAVIGYYAADAVGRFVDPRQTFFESGLRFIVKDQKVRQLVSAASFLGYTMDVKERYACTDWVRLRVEPTQLRPDRFPLHCYQCSNLEVTEDPVTCLFVIKALLTGSSYDGGTQVNDLKFKGTYNPHIGHPLQLESEKYCLSLYIDEKLIPYCKEIINFRKILASALHLVDEQTDWVGYALMQESAMSLSPLFLAYGCPNLSYYMPQPEKADYQPKAAYKTIQRLSRLLRKTLIAWRYTGDDRDRVLQGISSYKQLVMSPEPVEPGSLCDLFPPLLVVSQLFERHQPYKQEYEDNLLSLFRSPKPPLYKFGPAEYLRTLGKTFSFLKENNQICHPFDEPLAKNMRDMLNSRSLQDPRAYWVQTFGFSVELIRALTLLRGVGDGKLLQAPERYDQNYYGYDLPKLIKEVYLKVCPLPLPEGVPESSREAFVDRAVTYVMKKSYNSIIDAVGSIKGMIAEVETYLRDFPSLPEDTTRQRALEYLLTGWNQTETPFRLQLKELCMERKYAFPLLTGQYKLDAEPHKPTEAYLQKLVDLQFENRGKRLDTVVAEFHKYLQDKYNEMMGRGWIAGSSCERYIYDTEVLQTYPWVSLAGILEENISRVDEAFLKEQLPFLDCGKGAFLTVEFCQGVARLLLSPGESLSLPEAYNKHFPVWVRDCFDLLKVKLPGSMIDQAVEKVLSGKFTLVQAVAAHVPHLYEMALGPAVQLKNPETCLKVAQDLLEGDSFLDCHRLKWIEPSHWYQAIIEEKQIPIEEYDLPEQTQVPFHLMMQTFCREFSSSDTAEYDLWKMSAFEVVCRFRETNQLKSQTALTSWTLFEKDQQERRSRAQKEWDKHYAACEAYNRDVKNHYDWAMNSRNLVFYQAVQEQMESWEAASADAALRNKYHFFDVMKVQYLLLKSALRVDPYHTTTDLDQDYPNDVSDESYEEMQDILCCLTRYEILSRRAGLSPNGCLSREDREVADHACRMTRQFFRLAINEAGEYLSSRPVTADQHARRRILRVYDRLLLPYLKTDDYEQAYKQLEVLISYADDCIDGARRGLMFLEQMPQVMAKDKTPDLFERLAYVLRQYRLEVIYEIASERAQGRFKDPIAYDLFLRNVFNLAFSLGLQECDQFYLRDMGYTEAMIQADAAKFIRSYGRGMIPAVQKAIQSRSIPATGDSDPSKIYMEQIYEWADKSTHYCNSYELDEELMEGKNIRPQVVANLLEDAGYVALIN